MVEFELPDPTRRWIRRGALAAGVGAVTLALALVALEGVLPGELETMLSSLAETLGKSFVAWSLAIFGGAYALWRVVRGRRRPPVSPEFAEDPPEASSLVVPLAGNRFERIVESHARSMSNPDAGDDQIREALGDVVVDVETRLEDRSREAVRASIVDGSWTDDRIAAAFLGGEDAPGYPLGERIRGWLRPSHAFERRVERTVDVIHDRMDGRRDPREPVSSEETGEVVA